LLAKLAAIKSEGDLFDFGITEASGSNDNSFQRSGWPGGDETPQHRCCQLTIVLRSDTYHCEFRFITRIFNGDKETAIKSAFRQAMRIPDLKCNPQVAFSAKDIETSSSKKQEFRAVLSLQLSELPDVKLTQRSIVSLRYAHRVNVASIKLD